MKRIEDSLRDPCNNVKIVNIWNVGFSEEEEKEKGLEKIFEEIRVENFPNMGKEIVNWIQEAQSPIYDKPRRNISTYISIKQTKASSNSSLVTKSCLTLETPWTVTC